MEENVKYCPICGSEMCNFDFQDIDFCPVCDDELYSEYIESIEKCENVSPADFFL